MPDRVIRDELLTSRRYWGVSIEAQRLFVHLLLCADDTARFSGNSYTIKLACFPGHQVADEKVEALLAELVDRDLVRAYTVEDERFIFIPRFKQRLRYSHSGYPAPPTEISDLTQRKTDPSQTRDGPRTDSGQTQVSPKTAEVKRSEVKRSEVDLEVIESSLDSRTRSAGKPSHGTRLQQDWVPPKEWFDWCEEERPDLDSATTYSSFHDYWIAKPGKDGRKADWFATWRNWVRNAKRGARA